MRLDFENSAVNKMIQSRPELRFRSPEMADSPTMLQVGLGTKLQPSTFMNDPIMQKSKAFNAMRFMLNRIGG